MLALVAMHVVGIWEDYYSSRDAISDFMAGICYSSMTYFFTMSGFWLFRRYEPREYPNLIIKRIKTLILPFIIWGAMKVVLTEVIGLLRGEGYKYDIIDMFKMMFFVHVGRFELMPLNGPLWYLIRLFTYILIAPIIYIVIKNKYVGTGALVLLAIGTIRSEYYGWLGWIFVFSLGAFIGIHYDKACICFVSGVTNRINKLIGNSVVAKSLLIFGCMVLYVVLWRICVFIPEIGFLRFSDAPIRKLICAFVPSIILPFIGCGKGSRQYSFILYCAQAILGTWLVQIVHRIAEYIQPIRNKTGVQQIIVLISMIIIVYLFQKAGEKLFPRVLAIMSGGR